MPIIIWLSDCFLVVISSFVEGFIWDSYTFIGLSLMLAGNLAVLAKPGILKRFSFTRLKTSEVQQ